MSRRRFLRGVSLATTALMAGGPFPSTGRTRETRPGKTFNLDYAFHDGMFAAHAGKDFVEQIRFAHDQGFRSIEDNGMMSRSVAEQERIGKTLSSLGMRMGVFVITTDSWHWKTSLATGRKEWKERIVRDCRTAVEVAARCGAKWMTVVSGNVDRSLPMDLLTANLF